MPPSTTVLAPGAEIQIERRPDDGEALWLERDALESLTGWKLAPEGLCRDEVCIPLPRSEQPLTDGDRVCASALWESLGRPVLHDAARAHWILGDGCEERRRQLDSLEAPDFTLPDIEGKLHSLSDFRGRKVFLATWASW